MSEDTSPVIVSGWIDWEPDERDEALRHFREVAAVSRLEAGCVDYAVAPDPDTPGRVRVFEHWTSEPVLREHLALPHVTAFRDAVAGLHRTGRDIALHRVASSEPMSS
jgi:quinol monooxygenase YgiN